MEAELRAVIVATNESLDELRDAHELLKKNHARALDRLSVAEQRTAEVEASREQIQNECREMYQEWNNQLAKQAQEFKNLESQMVPQHILHLERVKLGNELRGNYEKEGEVLRKQIESISENLSQVKRDSQNYQMQWENAISEKELMQARLSKLISTLQEDSETQKQRIHEVESMNSDLKESVRLLETRIINLSVSETHLLLEQEAMRKEAEEAIQAKCQLELSQLRTVKELQSQCSLLEAQLECHQTKAQETIDLKEQVLEQLKQSEAKTRQYRVQIAELQQNLEETRSQCDTQKQTYDMDISITRQRLESLNNQFEIQIQDYQNRISTCERNEELLRAEYERRGKEREAQSQMEFERLKELLLQSQHQTTRLQEEVQKLSEELLKQNTVSERKLAELTEERNKLMFATEKAHADLNAQVQLNEKIHTELRGMHDAYNDLSKKHSSHVSLLNETKDSLTRQTEQNKQLLETNERLQVKIKSLREESKRDSQDWRSEREVMIHELRASEDQVKKLQENVATLSNDRIKMEQILEACTEKSKKDHQHHKRITRDLRDRMASLLGELAVLKEVQGYNFQESNNQHAASMHRSQGGDNQVGIDLRSFEGIKALTADVHAFGDQLLKK